MNHRWSGWPGAWCLDCGTEDPHEIAIAEGDIDFFDDPTNPSGIWKSEKTKAKYDLSDCKEPGSKRHDPYWKRLSIWRKILVKLGIKKF